MASSAIPGPRPAVSRRSFLAASAMGAGALALTPAVEVQTARADEGQTSALWQTSVYEDAAVAAESTEELACDIVVVGSGIAGMSAAVEAAEAGASVIVLEKRSVTGGDSSICSGNYYCCGSQKQDSMGYTEYGTAEEIAQFYYDQSDGDANMDICRLVAENGGAGMDWLVAHGCDFDKKPGDGVSDRSMLSTSGGMGIVDALVAAAEAAGAQMLMETRAIEVLTEDGKVSGVVARQGAIEYRIAAKAVVLASGGFDGQDWSKQLYAKGAVGWHTFSSPANTGDGIELARQAGALTVLKGGLSQIHLVGRDPLPLNDAHSKLRMVSTGIYVSDLGYRCANESMTSQFDYFVPFVKSGRKEFTIICDSQQPEATIALLQEGVELGVVDIADTIEELAEQAGLPVYTVCKTVERYNGLCELGEDEDFGKNPEDMQRVEQAPFYAVQITPNTNDSFGAVPISVKAEALDASRAPVPGLYAAGTLANVEMFYLRYAVSGASLCMGTVTGRVAAQEAMAYMGM